MAYVSSSVPTDYHEYHLCNSKTALLRGSPFDHNLQKLLEVQNQLGFSGSSSPTSVTGLKYSTCAAKLRQISKPFRRIRPMLMNCHSSNSAGGTNLGFDPVQTDYIYIMKCGENGEFSDGALHKFAKIELNPFACVLNYGQGIIEELKAYRKRDDSIVIFRPDENGLRMRIGADRMCMPAPTIHQFVEAVKAVVLANKHWVPPSDKGFLLIRPLLMGTGPVLSLTLPTEYTFLIYVTPVGNYYKGGSKSINLVVQSQYSRAFPSGVGNVKAIGNYAGILKAQAEATANGFSDVLYLDSVHQRYIEGTSTSNIFVVKDNIIYTPALGGTILPGVTRKNIIEIARSQGFQVKEQLVPIDDLFEADEVFCTGNAICLLPVDSITYEAKRVCYAGSRFGEVSQQLYLALSSLQMDLVEDEMGRSISLK